ncbi:MAG: HNH endonuclease [Vibrionaceae bacterium]
MKLTVDLSALLRAVEPLGSVVTDFAITSQATELKSLAKGLILNKDVRLEEIDGTHGVLSYDGYQVMLYIPDQGEDIEAVLENGKLGRRIHVAECSTLELMRNTGRFKRYDVISRVDGLFPVFGAMQGAKSVIKGEAALGVCKNCLKILNYKGYESQSFTTKEEVFDSFSFKQFFATYSSYFKSLPDSNTASSPGTYTADWQTISSQLRSKLNYTCEQCGVCLVTDKRLVHTHHINGNKTDNSAENLRVLCADCHKKQPHHAHVHVSHEDMLKINQHRREQHKFDVFDYNKIRECADTALDGLLQKCQAMKLPGAELGIAINDNGNMVSIDLCWPRRKVAVLINMANANALRAHGWNVFAAFDALSNFEGFQAKVR